MTEMDTETGTQKMEENYLDFLDDNEDQGTYTDLVKEMINERKYRLIVDINDVRKKFPERAAGLLNNSFEEHERFQIALKKFVETIDSDYAQKHFEFLIGFSGSFGKNHVSPRTLTSSYLGKLVCAEGIVTRCTTVKVKPLKTVHYCPATNEFVNREHKDFTSFAAAPASGVFPKKDKNENPLEMEFGLSIFKDHQTISIQELPEDAPPGQMPRSLDIILDNDLVDKCKPGDRIKAVGSFRCLPGKHGGYTSGSFRTLVIAGNIIKMDKEVDLLVDNEDVTNCKKLCRTFRLRIVDVLSKSLAPSIYGHEYVKKSILLLLLGGVERVLPNGTRIRGDINVLLIGDPSVAKSQLLRYVLCTAPRAIPTTGRGSSGVGLTAAVTTDHETNERRLEAGAMVLADRGVICIDEFDKMTDIDRTAIHEVMEQGRVTIAKAGIHATLNARCSVLAAANPVYGRYDPYKTPMENIGLQDSLLSRFDLLFVLLDNADPDMDKMISDHVVRMHRYRSPREQDGEPLSLEVGAGILSTKNLEIMESDSGNSDIYEKYDPLLHGNSRAKTDKIFTVTFMRKYIHIAKMMKPELTDEAEKAISDEYAELRSREDDPKNARTQPVTARTLETLIRLSTAHAKARLSKKVTIDDAHAAIELVQFAYFKEVLKKQKKTKPVNNDSDEEEEVVSSKKTTKRTRRAASQTPEDPNDVYAYTEEEEDDTQPQLKRTRVTRDKTPEETVIEEESAMETETPVEPEPVTVSAEKYKMFLKYLNELFTVTRTETLEINQVEDFVQKKNRDFSKEEIRAALEMMSTENSIMITGNEIMRI